VRAVLIANQADTDPGFVGHALRARGYCFTEHIRELHESWPSPSAMLDGAGLVVALGSAWTVHAPEFADEVAAEAEVIRTALASGIPFLGICFGAQVLSVATGGSTDRAPRHEVGWCDVDPDPDLGAPARALSGPWMQWHYDMCLPPPEARILAANDVCVQAFVVPGALGVQFHPEVTEAVVSRWTSGPDGEAELATLGLVADDLMTDTRRNVTSAERRCEALVEWFLTDVVGPFTSART
jgi:GMP synthase-like glutamine amidotransferase